MWNAQRYVQAIAKAPEWLNFFAPKLESIQWEENERVLEYGCGEGRTMKPFLLPQAKATNSKIYGIDYSADMIESAKNSNTDPNIMYEVGDIMSDEMFPFEGVTFDKIFSFYVMHWIKDYRELLRRFYKILKPGGKVCILFVSDHVIFPLLQELAKNTKWASYMEGVEKLVPEWIEKKQNILKEFKAASEQTGFNVLELENNDGNNSVKMELKTYTDICVAFNPYLCKISPELYTDLATDCEAIINRLKPWKCEIKDGIVDYNVEVVFTILQKPLEK